MIHLLLCVLFCVIYFVQYAFCKAFTENFFRQFHNQEFLGARKNAPRKSAPRKMTPQEKLPSPVPLKKYFVKLLHVMKYLSVENFVNFNFRQS